MSNLSTSTLPMSTLPGQPSIRRQRREPVRSAGIRTLLAAASVVLAGCATGNEATTPTIELTPTSTPITTAASSTTSTESDETTEPTESSEATGIRDARVAEVEAAVQAARIVQIEVLTNPSIPVDRMEDVVTGRALAASVENTLKSRAEGRTFVGDFVGVPRGTELLGDAATHLQCGLDGLAAYSAAGDLITPADEKPYLLRYTLEHDEDRGWRVELVAFEGSEPQTCEQ